MDLDEGNAEGSKIRSKSKSKGMNGGGGAP